MDFPERPEMDFSIPSQIIALTQCGHCARTIPQSLALTYRNDHFCDAECAENEHSLEQLRMAGL